MINKRTGNMDDKITNTNESAHDYYHDYTLIINGVDILSGTNSGTKFKISPPILWMSVSLSSISIIILILIIILNGAFYFFAL